MADVKWIKITVDIFDDEKIQVIHSMPEGAELVVIWLRLLCLAGKCNADGCLMLTPNFPYNDELLSSLFKVDIKLIKLALTTFEQLGMIEVIGNKLMITNWFKYQSGNRLEEIKELNRLRQQRYRENHKQLPDNSSEEDSNATHNAKSNGNCSYTNNILNNNNNLKDNNKDKSNRDCKGEKGKGNIAEYDEILKNASYTYPGTLKEKVIEWLEYKAEKREQYKPRGLKTLANQIYEKFEQFGEQPVIDVIDSSMASNYKGILWEKINATIPKQKVDPIQAWLEEEQRKENDNR